MEEKIQQLVQDFKKSKEKTDSLEEQVKIYRDNCEHVWRQMENEIYHTYSGSMSKNGPNYCKYTPQMLNIFTCSKCDKIDSKIIEEDTEEYKRIYDRLISENPSLLV